MHVYVGTYTRGTASEGIYRCTFDPDSGILTPVTAEPPVENPSYLALAPSGRALYACNEVADFGGQTAGAVSAFAIDPADGHLSLLNQQSTLGPDPCHLSAEHSGHMVMVANYSGGSVATFPVLENGALGPAGDLYQFSGSGPNEHRQKAPHAHSIWPDPSNHWALACDLGTDKVMLFGLLTEKAGLFPARVGFARVAPGAGPRHLAFHPNGRWIYLINEIRSAVTLFDWHADRGLLVEVEHIPALPADFGEPNGAADIHLTPDGRYLYATNRGQDALAIFAVHQASGRLTLLGYQPTGGQHPRNFAIDPSGRWLLVANMHSNNIVTFAIDAATGQLRPTGHQVALPWPSCILFAA